MDAMIHEEIKKKFMSLCKEEFLDTGLASSFFSEHIKHVANESDAAHTLFCDYKTYMALKPATEINCTSTD